MTVRRPVTGVKVLFTHDTDAALAATAALVNTDDAGDEHLPDVASLDEFVRGWGYTGERKRTEAELRSVRALRPRLRRLWHVDEDEAVEIVNRLLRESKALPQLAKHDHWDYHLHATAADAPLATRIAVDSAMAFVDLIRMKQLDRLRICSYDGCDNVVVDLSKNRSKRFCEGNCGNKAAVAAYRARKAGKKS